MSDAITPKPEERKSWVQQWVDRAKGEIKAAPPTTPASYVRETGTTVGEYAEGGIVGSLLGAAHAKFGLDTSGGPVDGWIAGAGALGAIGLSGHMPLLAARLRRIGADAFTVLSFRKGYSLVKHEPFVGGGSAVQRMAAPGSGIAVEDPIERASKGLG